MKKRGILTDTQAARWRRHLASVCLHGPLAALYALLALTCRRLHLPAGQAAFLVLLALCAASFAAHLARIQKAQPARRRLLSLMSDLWIVTVFLPGILSIVLYEANFLTRIRPSAPSARSADAYEGLILEESGFVSNGGQRLYGCFYRGETGPASRAVILVHGNGATHGSYPDVIRFFAENGCLVFAYDATGCGESQGISSRGLPQGVIDLDYAIRHVEESAPDLPVYLFGHSWGAYCACACLSLHPEVKGVAALAGFNASSDAILFQGRAMIGRAIYPLWPCLALYEELKFGSAARLSALEGFGASDARVLVVHSDDDATVPPEYGIDLYRAACADDPRFTFVRYGDRGHTRLFSAADGDLYLGLMEP